MQAGAPYREKKRLSNRSGEINTDYLFAGALALIIAGALSLTIYFSFFGKSEIEKERLITHYHCDKCGGNFNVKANPADIEIPIGLPPAEEKLPTIDCELCGAKDSAWPMNKCPKCDEYYVLPGTRDPEGWKRGEVKDICPKCGADFFQYRREQARKRRAE